MQRNNTKGRSGWDLYKSIRRIISALNTHLRIFNRSQKFYLAGPISSCTDREYIDWRADMTAFLRAIGHTADNPLDGEALHGDPENFKRMVADMMVKNPDQAREFIRSRIIDRDYGNLRECDAVIAYVPNYSVGTSAEMGFAYLLRIPVYVVTPIPPERWGGWLLGLSSLVFKDFVELKTFLKTMDIVSAGPETMATCFAVREKLGGFNALPEKERDYVRRHALTCDKCFGWAKKHKIDIVKGVE